MRHYLASDFHPCDEFREIFFSISFQTQVSNHPCPPRPSSCSDYVSNIVNGCDLLECIEQATSLLQPAYAPFVCESLLSNQGGILSCILVHGDIIFAHYLKMTLSERLDATIAVGIGLVEYKNVSRNQQNKRNWTT